MDNSDQSDAPSDRQPASEAILEQFAQALGERIDSVAGQPVRIDAGENGQLWVAARGAAGDEEVEQALLQSLQAHLEAVREDLPPVDVRIASGRMEDDLVFVCHIDEAAP